MKPHKVRVQYHPVATAIFSSVTSEERLAVRDDLGLHGHYPVISCVAGFRGEKRQIDLIRAIVFLRTTFPKVRLVLVGSGCFFSELSKCASETGVVDTVSFVGEREDVPALLANSDVFVLPSSVEPFGMASVEAMAAGVPVIVAKTGGLLEIVTDGVDGLHVPFGEPEAIAKSVSRVCREPRLAQQLIGGGRIKAASFDEGNALKRLISHFYEVLPTHSGN